MKKLLFVMLILIAGIFIACNQSENNAIEILDSVFTDTSFVDTLNVDTTIVDTL